MPCKKIQHKTKDSAKEHLKQLKRYSKKNKKQINRLGIYHCHECQYWHVGTDRFKRKRAIWITNKRKEEKTNDKGTSNRND